MKNIYKILALLTIALFGMQSCEDQDDILNVPSDLQVQNFIWKGLNLYYLWQADVPELSDDVFANQNQLNAFLRTEGTPENLFQDLLNKPVSKFPNGGAVDRFSVLVDDYVYLENLFQGVTKNHGAEYTIYRKTTGSSELIGVVHYIIPGSDAASKNIHRGDIFYAINGAQLTVDNYRSLYNDEAYILNFANYDGGNFTPNGESVSLTKTELTENPVFIKEVIPVGAHKVAYLMYNGFTANFDSQLNTAFGEFATAGATDLVLDLRYNGGGSVKTATRLASMITGQFTGQLFAKERWNDKVQAYFEANNPGTLVNNFTDVVDNGVAINKLNLTKVYILTTHGTASASELVINGLKPYINVVQVGDVTIGKNVASITVYDSPTFGTEDRNPNHTYAMQPLVLKTTNKDGFGDYQDGLQPTVLLKEDINDLGVLGDINEPLLSTALGIISSSGRMIRQNPDKIFPDFKNSKSILRFGNEMYIDTPKDLSGIKNPF
ncbi:MAG: S41 family peptidase [Flavobacterium sp.]|nr:S41 family peptidase [Flavobacterium sp.]